MDVDVDVDVDVVLTSLFILLFIHSFLLDLLILDNFVENILSLFLFLVFLGLCLKAPKMKR